jgi:hypothetical protein
MLVQGKDVQPGNHHKGQQRAKPLSKWAPLFDKLAEPGDSIAIPAKIMIALRAETVKRTKAGSGHYRVLRTDDGGARIWRIEPPASKHAPAKPAEAPKAQAAQKTHWRALDAPLPRAKAAA